MNTRILSVVALLALAAALAAATLPGSASSAAPDEGGITVQGTASVASVPDRAELSFGVESQAQTAKAALAANAGEMRRVLAALRAAGAADLKTQYVTLSPRLDAQGGVQAYVATNSVSAVVKQLGQTGAVIDAAVAAGANQVYGPTLTRGDESALYRQALQAAVGNARESAQALAAAANVSLGRVTTVVESGAAPTPLPLAAAAKAEDSGPTPIEGGSHRVTAVVTVTFSVS